MSHPGRAPRRSRRREEPDLRAEDDVSALPAFLTAAPRPAATPVAERFVEPAGEAEPKRDLAGEVTKDDSAPAAPKPRRRRRPRFEGPEGSEGGSTNADDTPSTVE